MGLVCGCTATVQLCTIFVFAVRNEQNKLHIQYTGAAMPK